MFGSLGLWEDCAHGQEDSRINRRNVIGSTIRLENSFAKKRADDFYQYKGPCSSEQEEDEDDEEEEKEK